MHWLYEKEEAGRWLHAHAERLSQGAEAEEHLRHMRTVNCRAELFAEPKCYRIISTDDVEASFKISGVICSLTLPPVTRPLRSKNPNHVRYLRQFVRLTGFGQDAFGELEEKVADIHSLFGSAVGNATVVPNAPAQYEGQLAIDIHARYLTERRMVPGQAHIPFSDDIDPRHILEDARDVHFVRTEDNVVQYSTQTIREDGSYSYAPLNPKTFKEGDVVEATVTFIAYPCGERQYKVVTTLRALTLVSAHLREAADEKRKKHEEGMRGASTSSPTRREPQPKRVLKRKYITYAEDHGDTMDSREG